MTAGAHEAGGGFGKSAGVNAARGVAVVAIAVLVGVLLMAKGLNKTDSVAAISGDSTTTTTTVQADEAVETSSVAADQQPETSEETVPAAPTEPRAPAEVKVLVLNGSGGIAGVAGRGSAKLQESGYAVATPDDARAPGPTVILYTEGFELDAQAVAAVFGVPVETVAPFDPANSPIEDTQAANVIVRIGNDQLIQI